ncbi:aldo/keto reductase [bacterium]|nr:aldo/keto reductase [bacterium]
MGKRLLGNTGESVTLIGFGGVIVMNEEQGTAESRVAEAFDRGVRYFDVAPTYGNAQERLGPALEPYRKKCFLACKTTQRSAEGAEKELHESLNLLRTDHFDLYQLHALTTREDVETAFGPKGAMEVFLKARKEGKTRFLGFSAHSEEAALLAMAHYHFDTILFPVNFVCWHQGNFGPAVLEKAKEKGMGILALKAMARGPVPEGAEKPYEKCWYRPIEEDPLLETALRFAWTRGACAAIPPGEYPFFLKAVEMAGRYKPLTAGEEEYLKKTAEGMEPLFKSA